MSVLDDISSLENIKKLNSLERKLLCSEIRSFLVDSISKTGGHLASNLGVVELTVALYTVFDIPNDKFVWDVGHQTYVNKILSGRKNGFESLRKFGGMSGFPKTDESDADVFNTGHSSTSISSALGLARARDLNGEKYSVGAVFGDGALTGGMMYEAMNDAGQVRKPLILILNDNSMSISKNVGSINRYLRDLRLTPGYSKAKKRVENFFDHIPAFGKQMHDVISKIKRFVSRVFLPTTIFENLGFDYLGPVDGHNVEKLISVLEIAKSKQKPVFVHIITKKGKGYAPAEHHPDLFHGIGAFDKNTGKAPEPKETYSSVFGKKLVELAEINDKVTAITAAMPQSTGLEEFSKKYKNRFFDVGIAEQHAVTMAAGLAMGGFTPVFPVYSSFLQRAYDQILHDVCLQKLHVVFALDRAGIVGADGETHQGIYDISFLSSMPNMTILSPSNFEELRDMLDYAVNVCSSPVAIRYPRGNAECVQNTNKFEFGKANVLEEGNEITLYSTGRMLSTCYKIREALGEGVKIVSLPTVLPLDTEAIIKNASKVSCIIEDGVVNGGLGEHISKVFAENNVNSKLHLFGFPDEPIVQGSIDEIDKKYGVDAESVCRIIKSDRG